MIVNISIVIIKWCSMWWI